MEYRREIDGLRAFAVVPVILFHAGFDAFTGGFVGVDVFFVISGYLITTIILSELEQGKFSIVNFYERRARRILPALFVVMLACIPLAWLWLLPSDMKGFSESLVAVSLFVSNVLFWRESGYFDVAAELKPLLHTWSLALEEQYYVFFPIFLRLFWKIGKRWIVALIGVVLLVSLTVAQWGAYAKPAASFFLLPTRAWELMIGALTAFYLCSDSRRSFGEKSSELGGWLGLALILYSVFMYTKATPFPGLYALVPTVGTALVVVFANQKTIVGRFIGNRALVGVGLVSYSAYLWHQPLFAFARHRSLSEPSDFLFFLLSVGVFVLAYFSWKYVEAPFRNKSTISRRLVFLLSLALSLIFCAFGMVGHINDGYRARLSKKILLIEGIEKAHVVLRDDGGCNLWRDQVTSPMCVKGDSTKEPEVALVGDSHASALAVVLAEHMKKSGKSFVQFTKNGCPIALTFQSKEIENCGLFIERTLSDIEKSTVKSVVVAARWGFYLTDYGFDNGEGGVEYRGTNLYTAKNLPFGADGMMRRRAILEQYKVTIEQLLALGKNVILIYPVPEQGWNVPKLMAKQMLVSDDNPKDFGVGNEIIKARNRGVIELFDSLSGSGDLVRVRPMEVFCDTFIKSRCVGSFGGVSFYYDENHLSNYGARLVVNRILPLLR